MHWSPLSVSPSVSPMPDHKSRTEGRNKLKIIVRKEAGDTRDPWPHLEVQTSKVKVARPLNAVIDNQSYLRNGKAYLLHTWYTDGVRRPASPTCTVTCNLKALSGCSSHYLQGASNILQLPHYRRFLLWLFSEFGAVYKIFRLTYLLTYLLTGHTACFFVDWWFG